MEVIDVRDRLARLQADEPQAETPSVRDRLRALQQPAPEPIEEPPAPPDEEPSLLERAESLVGAIPRGAMDFLASAVEGAGVLAQGARPMFTPASPAAAEAAQEQEIFEQQEEGREAGLEAALEGDLPTSDVGALIRLYGESRFPDPTERDPFVERTLQGLGSTAPFIAGSILSGGAAVPVLTALGVAGSEGELLRRAQAGGATGEELAEGVATAAVGGATEMIPIGRAISRAIPAPVRRRALQTALGALEEASQEAFQQVTQNLAAQEFDPDTEITEGLEEAATQGGTVGFLLNAIATLAGARIRGGQDATTTGEVQDELEGEPATSGAVQEQPPGEGAVLRDDVSELEQELTRAMERGDQAEALRIQEQIDERTAAPGQAGGEAARADGGAAPAGREGDTLRRDVPQLTEEDDAGVSEADEAGEAAAVPPEGTAGAAAVPEEVPAAQERAAPEGARERIAALQEPPAPTVSLDTEVVTQVRERLGLSEMTTPARRRWGQAIQEAQETGLVGRSEAVAEGIIAKPRPVNDTERAALLLKATQLENDIESTTQDAAQAAEAGDSDAWRLQLEQQDAMLEQLDTIQKASRLSGTETARSLAFLRAGVVRDQYSQGQVLLRAKANKGKALTGSERRRVSQLTEQLAAAEERAAELERTGEARAQELARERAAQELDRLRQRRGRAGNVRQRRTQIKGRLRELGLQVSAGLNPEAAFQLTQLARTYVEEGVTRLDEVVARMRSDVPSLEERDIIDALAGRFGRRRIRSETQQQLDELRKESRLVAKIEDLLGTTEGAPERQRAAPRQATATVKELQTTLNQLQETLLRSERIEQRVAAIYQKLDAVRQAIGSGEAIPVKKQAPDPQVLAEAKAELREARTLMRTNEQIQDLEEQLQTGEFKPRPVRERREVSQELTAARARRNRLRNEIDQALKALRPLTVKEAVLSTLELPRNMLASGDIGALGRQGIFHTLNPLNVGKTARAGRAMVRSLLSDKSTDEIQQILTDSPLHAKRVKAGLAIKDVDNLRFRDRETVVRNNLIERWEAQRRLKGKEPNLLLSGLATYMRASERNMIVGLNVLRAEVFDDFVRKNPNLTDEELRGWANYVNVTTGHGTALGKAGDTLNRLFFSPRLLTSRVMTPYTLAKAASLNRSAALQVGRDVGGLLIGAGTVYFLASLVADLEFNPDDSDFLKIQVGNTRIDPLGGYGQTMRLFLRTGLAIPDVREQAAKIEPTLADPPFFGPEDPYGLVGQYLQYKLTPGLTAVTSLATGQDWLGRETPRGEILLQNFTPIMLQEAMATYNQNGALPAAGAWGLSMIGVGASTYENPFKNLPVEQTLRRADYSPNMSYEDAWDDATRVEAKRLFREELSDRIQDNKDLLEGLPPTALKQYLQAQAGIARSIAKREVQ